MLKRNLYVVYKRNNSLDKVWQSKFEKILEVIEIPAFAFFTYKGYAAWFIDGTDLYGENLEHQEPKDIVLNGEQRVAVIKIFKDIVYAGIKTGYILADFTRKNVMLEGNDAFLIDYDVIIEKMNKDYIKVFQAMLNYLKIDYVFDGNLKELYKQL